MFINTQEDMFASSSDDELEVKIEYIFRTIRSIRCLALELIMTLLLGVGVSSCANTERGHCECGVYGAYHCNR